MSKIEHDMQWLQDRGVHLSSVGDFALSYHEHMILKAKREEEEAAEAAKDSRDGAKDSRLKGSEDRAVQMAMAILFDIRSSGQEEVLVMQLKLKALSEGELGQFAAHVVEKFLGGAYPSSAVGTSPAESGEGFVPCVKTIEILLVDMRRGMIQGTERFVDNLRAVDESEIHFLAVSLAEVLALRDKREP